MKIGISMSHRMVMRLIDQLGANHDMKVEEWQAILEKSLPLSVSR